MSQESSSQKKTEETPPQESKPSSTVKKKDPVKKAAKKEELPTLEELLSAIREKQAEAIELFGEIYGHLGDDTLVPPDVRPGPDDLVLLYDIRLYNQDGELIRLKGRNDFPEALHSALIPQTLQKFQRAFIDQVGEPLASRLMRHLSDKVVESQEPSTLALPATPVAATTMSEEEDEDDSPDEDGFLSKSLP